MFDSNAVLSRSFAPFGCSENLLLQFDDGLPDIVLLQVCVEMCRFAVVDCLVI